MFTSVLNSLPPNNSAILFNTFLYPGITLTGIYISDTQNFIVNESGLIFNSYFVIDWKLI